MNPSRVASFTTLLVGLTSSILFAQGWTDDGTVVRLTTSTDNVGVGTTSPYTKLTLAGTLGYTNATTPLSYMFQSGATNAERFLFSHSPTYSTYGLAYNDVEDQMIFKGNGTAIMNIDLAGASVGNVGIGGAVGNDRLFVSGNSAYYSLRAEQYGTGHGLLSYVNTSSGSQTVLSASSNMTGLIVKGDGKVGVGTTIPSSKLHVAGGDAFFGGNLGVGTDLPSVRLHVTGGSDAVLATPNTGYIIAGGSTGEHLVIDSDEIMAKETGTTAGVLNIQQEGGPVWIGYEYGSAQEIGAELYVNNRNDYTYTTYAGSFHNAFGSGSGTPRVGIKGRADGDNQISIGVLGEGWGEGGGGIGVQGVGADLGIYGVSDGFAGYFDGNVYSTGSYQGSDQKLKRNIMPLGSAVDKVLSLKPKTFEFRTNEFDFMNLPSGRRYGFVAQEVAEIFPEMVKPTKQLRNLFKGNKQESGAPEFEEFLAMDYVSLVPVLTAALQEQQEMIGRLVAALEKNGIEVDINLPGDGKSKGEVEPTKSGSEKTMNAPATSELEALPTQYGVSQNFPNPFNPNTTIEYALPESHQVTIKVYNSLGQEVRTLVDEFQQPGYKSVVWDGKNNIGSPVASGSYVYRITAGDYVKSEKMMLAK
jgi:hypothetical protein